MTRPADDPATFPALCPLGHRREVRVSHSRKLRWFLPLIESVGLLARRAQVREAERRMLGRAS